MVTKQSQPLHIRDRIKELRRVPAQDLAPNPRNWRKHPEAQTKAMRAVLQEIGYAGALLAREVDGKLILIDGHLRAEIDHHEHVPVLVLDVTEAEADKLLATYDPLASLSKPDTEAFAALLKSIEFELPDLKKFANDLMMPYQAPGELQDPEPQVDKADELRKKWGTDLGQFMGDRAA
ncbi:MAG: hypothetical protein JO166_22815 [Deltaproteobacteria bacterium]|nr:hypothetical protein [Deltaproteobacteria bacterium]